MIILPEEDASGAKNQAVQDLEAGQSPEELANPPPPYSSHNGGTSYQNTDLCYDVECDRDASVRAETRFWRSMAIAVLIWSTFGLALRLAFWNVHFSLLPSAPDSAVALPTEEDGEVIRCIYSPEWNHTHRPADDPIFALSNSNTSAPAKPKYKWRPRWLSDTSDPFVHNATASFHIPEATKLFFFSRGTLSRGSVDFSVGTADTVKVSVDVVYISKRHLDRASVCLLRRDEGQVGVGIYTPELTAKERRSSREAPYYYHIKVEFPPQVDTLPVPPFSLPVPSSFEVLGLYGKVD